MPIANPPPPAPEAPARAFNKEVAAAADFLEFTRGHRLATQLKMWAKLRVGWEGPESKPMDRECCVALAALIIACPPDWAEHWSLVPHPDGSLEARLVLPGELGRASTYAERRDGELRFTLFDRGDGTRYLAAVEQVSEILKARFPAGLVEAPE